MTIITFKGGHETVKTNVVLTFLKRTFRSAVNEHFVVTCDCYMQHTFEVIVDST
jgi:hypothetical protein